MNRDRPRLTLSLALTWELGAAAGIRGSKLYHLLRSTWALGHNGQVGYGKSDAHFNILVTNVRHNETITTKLRRVHDSRARTIRERGCRTGPNFVSISQSSRHGYCLQTKAAQLLVGVAQGVVGPASAPAPASVGARFVHRPGPQRCKLRLGAMSEGRCKQLVPN